MDKLTRNLAIVLGLVVVLQLCIPLVASYQVVTAEDIYIVDARPATPLILVPGSTFNVTLYIKYENYDMQYSWITAPGITYNLTIVKTYDVVGNEAVITFRLPSNVKPELYDLHVVVNVDSNMKKITSLRSIWVLKKWPSEIRFMHITDIHIGVLREGFHTYEHYETAIALANALPVDFVVITGDDVDIGNDVKSLEILHRITNKCRKPTFIIPGNHDHTGTSNYNFKYKYYGKYVGAAYWYRTLGSFLLVGLDSGLEGYIDSLQLQWLEEVLSGNKDKNIILFTHHPLFNQPGRFTGNWTKIENIEKYLYGSWLNYKELTKNLLRLIETYNVKLVVSGHIHRDCIALYNNKTYFVATSVTCGGPVNYRGFRLITIDSLGNVKELTAPGKAVFSEMNSYNIELAYIMTYNDVNFNSYSAAITLRSGFELNLLNVPIYFYLNASLTPEKYKLYVPEEVVKSYQALSYGDFILFKVYVDLTPDTNFTLTISSYTDTTQPEVDIILWSPKKPISGTQSLTIDIKATDTGWGLMKVLAVYKTPTTSEHVRAFSTGPNTFQVVIPPIKTKELYVKAIAIDLAGNKAETAELKIEYVIPATLTPTPTPTTTPTTPTPTTTPTTTTPTTPPTTPPTPVTPTTPTTPVEEAKPISTTTILAIVIIIIGIIITYMSFRKKKPTT